MTSHTQIVKLVEAVLQARSAQFSESPDGKQVAMIYSEDWVKIRRAAMDIIAPPPAKT